MKNSSTSSISEKKLQTGVHRLLSEPSKIYTTASGKRLQVLSPGRLNVHEGPDFLDIALLLQGNVIVADAEFHVKSSEWNVHNHSVDENYKSVVLHIVFDNDVKLSLPFETLIMNHDEVRKASEDTSFEINIPDVFSIEELQQFALIRLLRKTSDAKKYVNQHGLDSGFQMLSGEFLNKYFNRRKRPVYTSERLEQLLQILPSSHVFKLLKELSEGAELHIPDMMQQLIKTKITDEGSHLRRELVFNSVLPLALCLANEESRINLFLWYWSTPALHSYGILKRRFKDFPQNFIWQQQGMLEYIRNYGSKTVVISDVIKDYGFAEVLDFYYLGGSPYKKYPFEEE
ncbi:MAG: hypothetical protein A2X61_02380 [Ignavibacteria bacterium GWB2_35_12]|nr:MAG: hypothetical protein A2X63_03555 [Ignavibacteria bacterium GWA2_35_8]OGU42429.1 MAG: hypothetical protein A2X61_02380 [Ignavibacteria bacterium GWB2_35_12]OGU96598.1 MAG: hypothetical protein A2220_11965 [Ignavibacteria bacterium RIFOXYA2_FULL_35_10]OGV24209.1 MAG: hypothetical protein A2475_08310 [Ignavibacteria bacterium RIFOXYC2_FULL_35_21]